MAHRYFTTDIVNGTARITGPDAAHLARVLRTAPGALLTLCDGAGTDYTAEVKAITPEQVELRILSQMPAAAEPTLKAVLYIGVGKGDKTDLAVQKAVELGAAEVRPFYSEFSVVKPARDDHKLRRWQRIAAEAAKQSGRGRLPGVYPPLAFDAMLKDAARQGYALFFHPGGGNWPLAALQNAPSVALITGPEGGFSPAETAAAEKAGCMPVGLGPRILRCETAPLAALAAVMAFTGNLGAATPGSRTVSKFSG